MVKRISLSSLFALVLLSILFVSSASAKSISGIPKDYEVEINYLIDKGIIEGYPDGAFHPKDKVDRAQAATMVGRAIDLNGEKTKSSFTDVSKKFYASGFIESAHKKGIVVGVGGGKYHPLETMTREQMASVITRAFDLKDMDDIYYEDVNEKENEHYDDIRKVTTAGIAVGTNTIFKPKEPISRDEFSVMLARAISPSIRVEHNNPGKPTEVIGKKFVKATELNVRKGPGTNHGIIGTLKQNTEVTIHSKSGNWYEITSGKTKGYVSSDHLADKPVSKPKPPTTDYSKFTVVVDPGHGGKDPGTSGNGITEKDLTLSVSKKVNTYLKNKGANVIMTRTGDTYPTLDQRTDLANEKNADIFVSIHANAGPSNAHGTETYHFPGSKEGAELARFIQTRLVKALDSNDRGVKENNFHVLRKTRMPAALVELGFVTNKNEAAVLKARQQEAADAVAQGVLDYLSWKK